MINSLLADTGFWYALLDDRDKHHERADLFLATCSRRLITTCPVLTETCYLLLSRSGMGAVSRLLEMGSQGLYDLFQLEATHLKKASQLMDKYVDLPMDLADASLVILAEELGHGQILSTDQRDFNTYRWKNRKPFENLLFPEG